MKKQFIIFYLIPVIIFMLVVSGCKKDNKGSENPDVYVVGFEHNGTKTLAILWKNGVAQRLTDGSNNAEVNNVYVAGSEFNAAKSVATLWKNGEAQPLTNGLQNAYAISVFLK